MNYIHTLIWGCWRANSALFVRYCNFNRTSFVRNSWNKIFFFFSEKQWTILKDQKRSDLEIPKINWVQNRVRNLSCTFIVVIDRKKICFNFYTAGDDRLTFCFDCKQLQNYFPGCSRQCLICRKNLFYKCGVCMVKVYTAYPSLYNHWQTCVGKPPQRKKRRSSRKAAPYECPNCDRQFKTKSNLKNHQQMNHQENFTPCKFCGKFYRSDSSLKCHEKYYCKLKE